MKVMPPDEVTWTVAARFTNVETLRGDNTPQSIAETLTVNAIIG